MSAEIAARDFEIAANEVDAAEDTVHWRNSVFHLGKGEGDTWRKLVRDQLQISVDCCNRTIQKQPNVTESKNE